MAPSQPPADPFVIEVRLKSTRELFNSLDPSPLLERDLDTRVETFITEWAEEAPGGAAYHLIIHLPAGATHAPEDATLLAAVQAYFRVAETNARRRMRKLLAEGRRSGLIGMAFLAACTTLSQLVRTVAPGALAVTISEGLLILGWVANWRPIAILLYEWRPIRKEIGVLSRLARLSVEIREDDFSPPSSAKGQIRPPDTGTSCLGPGNV